MNADAARSLLPKTNGVETRCGLVRFGYHPGSRSTFLVFANAPRHFHGSPVTFLSTVLAAMPEVDAARSPIVDPITASAVLAIGNDGQIRLHRYTGDTNTSEQLAPSQVCTILKDEIERQGAE